MSALAGLSSFAHPVLDTALVSGMGQHHTSLDRTKNGVFYKGRPFISVSLAGIVNMAANPPSVAKEAAQWLIPSSLASRVHAEQREQGRFYCLWADIDEPGGATIADIHRICIDAVGADCLTYASRSATQAKQKARIIIPLNEPCDGPTFVVLQTILNERVAKAGLIPDRASQRVGQLCYLPNRGEFYSFEISQDIGLLDWLVAFATDMEAARIEQVAQDAAQAAQMKQAKVRATQRIASGQTSPIDAFNHGYDVALLLNQYGYLQKSDRYLSPNSSSKTPGVVIMGNRWISSHGSDSGIGKECPGGTSGDAFDLFIRYECGGDRNAAIKAAGAMFVNSEGKTITQANQRSYMQAQDSVTFDAGDLYADYPDSPSQADLSAPTQAMPAQAIANPGAATQAAPAKPKFQLVTGDDLRALSEISWRIKGVLPTTGLAAIYGPSASGKSFLAFHMACAIAQGEKWFDYRVKAAPVVYVALEGEAGFKTRAQAWERRNGCKLPADMGLILQPFSLADDVAELAQVVPAGAVVIVDTLNRAAPTADENSSSDMGAIIEAAKQLQALTGGIVVLIHHAGKNAAMGLRGHSSLFAALDAVIEVSRKDDSRSWRVAKAKDGMDSQIHDFRLEVVQLGFDADGDAITSCVIVDNESEVSAQRRETENRLLSQLLDVIVEAHKAGASFASSPDGSNSLWKRRDQMPEAFHKQTADWFAKQSGRLVRDEKIKLMPKNSGFRLVPFDAVHLDDGAWK